MICTNCNHEQDRGKFCESCGTPLNSQETVEQQANPQHQEHQQAASIEAQPTTANTTQNAKEALSKYGTYFLDTLKNPTTVLNLSEKYFVNGLITIGIYIVTFGLAIYFLLNGLFKEATSYWGVVDESLPFFTIFSRVALIALLFVAIGFFSMFVLTKFAAKSNLSFKHYIGQYGGLVVPFAAVSVIALIIGLFGATFLTVGLLLISLVFLTFIVPALFAYDKTQGISNQRVYISLGSSVIAMIISYFVIRNSVLSFIEEIEELVRFF
ncbi:zinc ribbon domain-containing protein [Ornithinibacillus halophilus]|uniref:Zinc-ribbon domain-containing protein n=1 Tax=Ornithinibacillus halophilus TaxID=930117 RepID=A0A1M5GGT9_9BACI|nr:zinc ribbon domain-containing protein [Ornithinibacillus halophilus]SHG02908.1 hypothetical protein SAMN05216225_10133 [Ornithinibacillus halophilus]